MYIRFSLSVILVLLSILGAFPIENLSKDHKVKVKNRQIGILVGASFALVIYLIIFNSANALAKID